MSTFTRGTVVLIDPCPPTDGTWSAGDLAVHDGPYPFVWKCVQGGEPGTWVHVSGFAPSSIRLTVTPQTQLIQNAGSVVMTWTVDQDYPVGQDLALDADGSHVDILSDGTYAVTAAVAADSVGSIAPITGALMVVRGPFSSSGAVFTSASYEANFQLAAPEFSFTFPMHAGDQFRVEVNAAGPGPQGAFWSVGTYPGTLWVARVA